MLKETELSTLLYFDLETSSEYSSFKELEEKNPRKAALWKIKHDKISNKDPYSSAFPGSDYDTSYISQAPLNAEFGRIVCVSFCYLVNAVDDGKTVWFGKLKSFYDNEATETSEVEKILIPVSTMLSNIERAGKSMRLCGYNIKKFDIPWLIKRMMINRVTIPGHLQLWGKKPWEITHFDIGEQWSLGNWDGYISLDLLTCILDITSPKEKMKGEYIGRYFHENKKYIEIKEYCEEDVKAVVRICHRLSGSILPLIFS